MDLQFWIEGFREGIAQMTWLEAIAVIFGLLSVWYARAQNILVFPTGIVSVLIYVYICYGAKLYADMGINVYYFIMSVYGWYFWTRKSANQHETPITHNNRLDWILSIGLFALAYLLIYFPLQQYTDSDVPGWDSLTTSLALVAMLLMARKKVENWLAWIATDIISVPLYFYKGLILTSFQFFVFLILAVMGYMEWKKALKAKNSPT